MEYIANAVLNKKAAVGRALLEAEFEARGDDLDGINESLTFHTTSVAIETIASEGLDFRVGQVSGSNFGRGTAVTRFVGNVLVVC